MKWNEMLGFIHFPQSGSSECVCLCPITSSCLQFPCDVVQVVDVVEDVLVVLQLQCRHPQNLAQVWVLTMVRAWTVCLLMCWHRCRCDVAALPGDQRECLVCQPPWRETASWLCCDAWRTSLHSRLVVDHLGRPLRLHLMWAWSWEAVLKVEVSCRLPWRSSCVLCRSTIAASLTWWEMCAPNLNRASAVCWGM